MAKLYELAERFNNISELLDDPAIDRDTVTTALATIEGDIAAKGQNIAVIIQSMDGDILAIDNEIKRLTDRCHIIKNRRDWLKGYIKDNMERINLTKIKTSTFTISLQNNPPSVAITDEKAIPAKYLTVIPQTTVPNKKDIAAAIKAGESVPGAELRQGKSIRIR